MSFSNNNGRQDGNNDIVSSQPDLVGHDDEESPLLQRAEGNTAPTHQHLSTLKILALTCINGGLQVFFSTVMANLAPYLQKLGLSKSATSSIVICLPLSGAFIGPLSGAFSDTLRTRWGRRRPIILVGAVLTGAFMILLAWTEQLVRLASGCRTDDDCGWDAVGMLERPIIALAVLFTLLMSICVTPVQAGVRSLMVDIAPADQQSRAASWAGRIQGVMAIFSLFASTLNLPSLPGLGRLTQFQALACLNLIALGSTVLITCIFIKEKDSRRIELGDSADRSAAEALKHIFRTVRRLKGKIRGTCLTQFCSWFAWFPFTYYNTTYIGELATPDLSVHKGDGGGDALAQAGSLASLNFAIVGFVMITTLPAVLPYVRKWLKKNQEHDIDSQAGVRELIWLWVGTQPLLGLLMVLMLVAFYQWQGIVLVAIAGIPWAVTQWVPFSIVGYEVSRLGLTGVQGDDDATDSESGAIMGVHNMAISLPQVLSGLISSVTYKIAEDNGSQVPTAWVLATSGIAAFLASCLAWRMLE